MTDLGQIRALTRDDLNLVLEWRNHPSIRSAMFTNQEIGIAEHRAWFDKSNRDPERHLLIVETRDEPLGFVQFNNVRLGGVSDWGFYARPNAPKGSGRLLGLIALDHAFGPLGLHKVCGQAIAYNEASIRLHDRLGFQREGELREQHFSDGVFHSLVCFGLLGREWKERRSDMLRALSNSAKEY